MRRSLAAIAVTIVGLWLILSFKSSPAPQTAVSNNTTTSTTIAAASPTTTTPPAGGPPSPDTSTTQASAAARTLTGDVFNNQYGPVQVAVVLNGSKIVDVKALQMPTDRARSADISSQAAPLLHDEVIQAQSARIDVIGGATFTSESYAQSLQSALDKANG